ncbi:hypothetical protein Tco_1002547 [Tanacetum coccineum]|uniref:Uncharacterized protein n=1 Tax=Tanacetum coccineum TaxID=301880 RepID=A0ABQ5F7N5_9ASTR
MGWVVHSDVVWRSCDAVLRCVVMASRDPALMRSGQLDYKIEFPYLTEKAKAQILQDVFTQVIRERRWVPKNRGNTDRTDASDYSNWPKDTLVRAVLQIPLVLTALAHFFITYGCIKDHNKTVKNGQARIRESEEYKKRSQRIKAEARKVKPQSNPVKEKSTHGQQKSTTRRQNPK